MDTVSVTINGLKPISTNSLYYRNRELTKEARLYRCKFFSQLQSQYEALNAFSKGFDRLEHYLTVSYTFYVPDSHFWTNKGYISARSMDWDNCIKLVQDLLFNQKYNKDWYDQIKYTEKKLYRNHKVNKISNIGIDDAFIVTGTASKLPSNQWGLEVEVKRHNLNSLIL